MEGGSPVWSSAGMNMGKGFLAGQPVAQRAMAGTFAFARSPSEKPRIGGKPHLMVSKSSFSSEVIF